MTTSPPLTFRARRFPVWVCLGIAAFLVSMGLVAAFAAWPIGTARAGAGSPALALLLLAILGVPAVVIFKLGNDLRRSRIVVTDDALDLRVSRFRIWAFRPLGAARLSWRDVHGVQVYEIPNFTTPTGTQVDYVLHTTAGTFAVSSIQFPDTERIAALVAGRIGRAVGDLPADVVPVSASDASGRRGVRLMRALGWTAETAGVVFPILMSMAWLGGATLDSSTIGGIAMTSGVLLMLGRSLRRFSVK